MEKSRESLKKQVDDVPVEERVTVSKEVEYPHELQSVVFSGILLVAVIFIGFAAFAIGRIVAH